MKKEKIELDSMFTPYTLDTYQTFDIGNMDDIEVQDYNDTHNTNYSYDDFEWSYDNKRFLQDLTEKRLSLLQSNIIDDVILTIDSDGSPWSPKEYNFRTDNANNIYTVNIDALNKYISDNQSDYDKNKLKSCDGFMWFGDENQTRLNYYITTVSNKEYDNIESYYYDMTESLYSMEYVTMELIKKDKVSV